MKSFFDPCYREKDCVPVAYSWYDRADMMKTTLEAVNHSHSLCEIMYVCEGGMSIETEAGRVELGRRQLVWLDAGIRHWNMSFSNELCSMMNIEFQYEASDDRAPSLRAIAQQDEATRHMLERGARVAVLNDTDNTLFRLMKAAIPLADGIDRDSERLCSLLCVQMMLEIARLLEQNQTQPSGTNRYVTEALAIMRRDYAEPLTAAIIAHQLHIQPTYLHRLFREHTNKTMNEHLQSIRLQQAKLLLTGTSRSLLEIAMDVGISSQQHFSRLFRKWTGLSPQEYRKTHSPGVSAE